MSISSYVGIFVYILVMSKEANFRSFTCCVLTERIVNNFTGNKTTSYLNL